ncbi:hypothetical protein [Algicola sagamiensis]|uniref:hypothetical protein n=1 Tax=Algicola sagamiensis TaxID=163869 RepID=UPI00036E8B61|nr:hypothetical protein [Algicola sagamiensis]
MSFFDLGLYHLAKIIHISAVIFWLGPALGSWLTLRKVRKHIGEHHPATYVVYKGFFITLVIEHIALIVMLTSGLTLAFKFGFFHHSWLQAKLMLIVLIIIPLEILDIWYGNFKIPKIFSLRDKPQPYTAEEEKVMRMYHTYITNFAIVVLPLVVLAIFILVIRKPDMSFITDVMMRLFS